MLKTIRRMRRIRNSAKWAREATQRPVPPSAISWEPVSGPQERAYNHPADELLYGGQAGGGKTDLLLGLAFTDHRSSIIFRRRLQDMKGPEGILSRAEEIAGGYGRLNRSDYVFRDLPGGRTVEFGGVQYEPDKFNYQGRAHDLKAFDELTQFSRSQYIYLIGWNRSKDPDQRSRVVAATNPPVSDDGLWVIKEWAPWLDPDFNGEPAEPGEIRWYVRVKGEPRWVDGPEPVEIRGEMREPSSRSYIPAELDDNPYLRDTGYERRLDALPEAMRKAYKLGDWTVAISDDAFQVIPSSWVERAMNRWEGLDEPGQMDALGVDPNYGGDDRAAIAPRHGPWFDEVTVVESEEYETDQYGKELAERVHMVWGHPAVIVVDQTGYGSACYEKLVENDLPVRPFNGAEGTDQMNSAGTLRMRNARAAIWWNFRDLLNPDNDHEIALPPDQELRVELTTPRYDVTPSGVKVEDKEQVKKRLGRSPDKADAVIQAGSSYARQITGARSL